MKLYSNDLYRQFRGAARALLRKSPELWKEYRRVGRKGHWGNKAATNFAFPLILCLQMLPTFLSPRAALLGFYALPMIVTGFSLYHANAFLRELTKSADFTVLSQWPVRDADFFDYKFSRLKLRAIPPGLLCVCYYAGHALVHGTGWTGVLSGVALGALQGYASVALGFLLAAAVPGWPLGMIGFAFMLAGFIPVMSSESLSGELLESMQYATLASPAGWTNMAFQTGVLKGNVWPLVGAIPLLLLCWGMSAARPWCRRNYRMDDADPFARATAEATVDQSLESKVSPPPGPDMPDLEAQVVNEVRDTERARLRDERKEALEARVLAGEPRAGLDWSKLGLLERGVAKVLSARELVLAEFLLGGLPYWSAGWKFGLKVCAFGVLLTGLEPISWFGFWSVAFPILLMSLACFGLMGGTWPGLDAAASGELAVPRVAFYPVGFREIVVTAWKVNLVRAVAWLPQLAIMLGVWAWRALPNPEDGMFLALKIVGLASLVQPALLGLRLVTISSNLGGNLSFYGFFKLIPFFAMALVAVAGIGVVMIGDSEYAAYGWAAVLAGTLLAYGYCAMMHQHVNDLVRAVR